MIVVIGNPTARPEGTSGGVAGTAAEAAIAAARAGSKVELVGKAGEDAAGDALMLALARGGVGHVALLRDPAHSTPTVAPAEDPPPAVLADESAAPAHAPAEPADRPALDAADVDLALRYLPEYGVLVVAEPQAPATIAVVAEAAAWVGARLIIVVDTAAGPGPVGLPSSAVVLEAPPADPDGAFATMLGELAAALDRGQDAEAAFHEVEARLALTRAPG